MKLILIPLMLLCLGTQGVDELSAQMDGRSIVPLLISPSDPAVLPSTRNHILREVHGVSAQNKTGPWRTFHPIEFIAVRPEPLLTTWSFCYLSIKIWIHQF